MNRMLLVLGVSFLVFTSGLAYRNTIDVGTGFAAGPLLDASDMSENNSMYWTSGANDYSSTISISDDTSKAKAGVASIKVSSALGPNSFPFVVFPKTRSANWDLHGTQSLEFWISVSDTANWQNYPIIRLGNRGGGFYEYRLTGTSSVYTNGSSGNWVKISVPLQGENWKREQYGQMSLFSVDYIEIFGHGNFWIDGLAFIPGGMTSGLVNLNAPDLDVTIIERSPVYPRDEATYPLRYPMVPNVTSKRTYSVGEEVTFTASIVNKGKTNAQAFNVEWLVDGVLQKTESVTSLATGVKIMSVFKWPWQNGQHSITCHVDSAKLLSESCRENNILIDWTDAWSFHFVVRSDFYNALEQIYNGLGSSSAEDYFQLIIRQIHLVFSQSTYDFAPNGVTAHVRVGKITVYNTGQPVPASDPSMDGAWYFSGDTYAKNWSAHWDWGLIHELMHQLGIVDNYAMNIEGNVNQVDGKTYHPTNGGMMGGGTIEGHKSISVTGSLILASIDVYALNSTANKRRGLFGTYLYDTPQNNNLRLLDENGQPIAGANVKLYQKDEGDFLDATAEITGTTDSQGMISLPNRPVILKEGPYYARVSNTTAQVDLTRINQFWLHIGAQGPTGFSLWIDGLVLGGQEITEGTSGWTSPVTFDTTQVKSGTGSVLWNVPAASDGVGDSWLKYQKSNGTWDLSNIQTLSVWIKTGTLNAKARQQGTEFYFVDTNGNYVKLIAWVAGFLEKDWVKFEIPLNKPANSSAIEGVWFHENVTGAFDTPLLNADRWVVDDWGQILRENPFGKIFYESRNGTFLIEVSTVDGRTGRVPLRVWEFNVAYARNPNATALYNKYPFGAPPTFVSLADKSVVAGQTLTFPVTATDPDDGSITITMENLDGLQGITWTGNSFSVTVPVTAQTGQYRIRFTASDGTFSYQKTVTIAVESSATNADLTISDMWLPPIVEQGKTLTLLEAISNKSSGNIGSFSITYTIYNGTVPSIVLGSRTVTSLSGSATEFKSVSLTIPSTLADGNYTIQITVDSGNSISEPDETNNTLSKSIRVSKPFKYDVDGDGLMRSSDVVLVTGVFFVDVGAFNFNPVCDVTGDGLIRSADIVKVNEYFFVDFTKPAAKLTAPSYVATGQSLTIQYESKETQVTVVKYELDYKGDTNYDVVASTPGTVTHTYTTAGTYTVTLRLTDDKGQTATATTLINVVNFNTQAPTVSGSQISGYEGVNLSWTGGSSPYWRVFRSVNGGAYTLRTTVNTRSFSESDTSILSGNTYKYYVQSSKDSAGSVIGTSSNIVSITVSTAAPSLTRGAISNFSIALSWSPIPSGSVSIERMVSGGSFGQIAVVTGTSWTDSKAVPGLTYSYKIRYTDGNSRYTKYSNTVSGTTTAVTSSLTAVATSGQTNSVSLSWTPLPPSGVNTLIERSDGGLYAQIASVSGGTGSFVDLAQSGTTYSYKVRFTDNSGGNGSYSGIASAAPTASSIVPVLNASSIVSVSAAGLSWTPVPNPTSHPNACIEMKNPILTVFSVLKSTSQTAAIHPSLVAGSSYTYKMRFINSASNGASAYSGEATFATPVPVLSVTGNGAGSVTLTIDTATSPCFMVYRSTDGTNFSYVGYTATSSFTNSGLSSGTTYYYYVKSWNQGLSSNTVSITAQ